MGSFLVEKKEQVKPLAPASDTVRSESVFIHDDDSSAGFISRRRQKCITWCGCSAAILLILVMIVLTLMLTVFHIKDLNISVNSVEIHGLDAINGSDLNSRRPNLKLTLTEIVSIKNPNVAAFNFDNTTTSIYYKGSVVGEVGTPAGKILARKRLQMNVSVDLMVDKMAEVGGFERDGAAAILPLITFMRINGKVKITNILRSTVVVKVNCTMNVNSRTQAIQDLVCRERASS